MMDRAQCVRHQTHGGSAHEEKRQTLLIHTGIKHQDDAFPHSLPPADFWTCSQRWAKARMCFANAMLSIVWVACSRSEAHMSA
jgi:hypothetical protein